MVLDGVSRSLESQIMLMVIGAFSKYVMFLSFARVRGLSPAGYTKPSVEIRDTVG